jgi:hypothetical protein
MGFISCVQRTHTVSIIKTNQCRETDAVCSEIHTKQVNTRRGQNIEIFNVNPSDT